MTSVERSVYRVVETFVSINGEGAKSGSLALFIRFQGCNLHCDYCDTEWANRDDAPYTEWTDDEIIDLVRESKVKMSHLQVVSHSFRRILISLSTD